MRYSFWFCGRCYFVFSIVNQSFLVIQVKLNIFFEGVKGANCPLLSLGSASCDNRDIEALQIAVSNFKHSIKKHLKNVIIILLMWLRSHSLSCRLNFFL